MLYIVLLLILATAAVAELKTNGFEIVTPVALMLIGLALADVLALIGRGTWNSFDLSFQVLLIAVLGSLALLLGSFLACRVKSSCLKSKTASEGFFKLSVNISICKYVILMLVVLAAIVLRMSETWKLAAQMGIDADSYSAAAKAVRKTTAVFNSAEAMKVGQGFSFLSRQLSKAASCASYLAVYLLAKAIVEQSRKEIVISGLFMVECWCHVIASGSRGEILYQGIAFAVILYILLVRKGYPVKKLTKIFFVVGAVLAVILSVGFWLSSALVGSKTSSGFVEYISFYFGCGLPSLQSIFESGEIAALTPGERTFYYLFAIPYKFGLISEYPSYSIAWVYLGSHPSNIFTGFARYYLDFGFVGLVLLSCISSFLLTMLYRFSKVTSCCLPIILTGFFCAQCFDFAREEYLFSRFFSTSSAVWLFILIVMTLFITADFGEIKDRLSRCFTKEQA